VVPVVSLDTQRSPSRFNAPNPVRPLIQ
jgi:hypothetical protein